MILPDFILPSWVNQHCNYCGMDDLYDINWALDQDQFARYKFSVDYKYNSRGFRDSEWPVDLKKSIWCIGDSFTVGIGSPLSHTWPNILQSQLKHRTINVSMDGGSNPWMTRKALRIIQEIAPETIIIHWSFLHRRENDYYVVLDKNWKDFYNNIKDTSWPTCPDIDYIDTLPKFILDELENHDQSWRTSVSDQDLKIHYTRSTDESDIALTIDCINKIEEHKGNCNVIYSVIPNFCANEYKAEFFNKLPANIKFIPEFEQLDFARDAYHYDIKTAANFVDQITKLL